ncbi:outer membrane lipoprotein-sorting protein (plasmid) [Enterobacter bugandensis]|uniref:outer membrane lipoprotein-sorting protein n=1 Tax=Enterobacter bugandensis TaxID=881260 RepID=UPI00283AB16F|nr:outer membrane lipoprotein-sorting protein [Enterobacter bugandensis]WMU75508.1 outer membrane lipoprotein-sorting protein [Enterobacter bugandensis]
MLSKMTITLGLYLTVFSSWVYSSPVDEKALEIIRRADEVRSPNKPFRYTLTISEYKAGAAQSENKQILDISMRFIKPDGETKADARSLARLTFPPRDKGKVLLSDGYALWFYTPELRRPVPVSPQQRLIGQIANGDVIVTNFEYAYRAALQGEVPCGDKICYSLLLERKSAEATWPKIRYYVEKEGDNRPFKASYYSLDARLFKEVTYHDFKPVLGRMRPTKIVVQDARNGKRYSVMEYSDIRQESLPDSWFTRESIMRGVQ